jgi:cell division protein FtsN
MAPSSGGRTLSRDFKDVRRHRPVAVGQAFNGWIGLGVGLALGLSVAVGVHLYDRRQPAAAPEPVPATAQAPASEVGTDEGAVPAQENAGPALDFYDVLPKQEVEVPPKGKTGPAAPGVHTPLPTGDIVLQAGSFKQSTEAEKMQAQLALLGISSRIQRASVDDETWYRVRIGPIATVEELRGIQAKLREAEINAPAVAQTDEVPLP